jgi:hypothetical protein
MRSIRSSIVDTTEKLGSWLLNELQQLQPYPSRSVTNTLEFVEKIKDIIVREDEVILSFDVENLFPNVPIGATMSGSLAETK